MQIQELNINENLNQIAKKLLYFFSYMMLNMLLGQYVNILAHIVYKNIMIGQIEHQKCHFLPFS